MRNRYLEVLGAVLITATAANGCDSSSDNGNVDSNLTPGASTPTPTMPGPGNGEMTNPAPTSSPPTTPTSGPAQPSVTTPVTPPVGPLDCTSVTPCGGDVVGKWDVASSCLEIDGPLDLFITSLACATVPATGQLQTTGSIEFKADGTYVDETTTTGFVSFPLDSSCLSISGVDTPCDRTASIFNALGWKTAMCSGGADACTCQLSTEQEGGMGMILPYTETTGDYELNEGKLEPENASYEYCAAGDTLTVTPQMAALIGVVELRRSGAPPVGAGGMSGVGGSDPMGGGGMSSVGGEGGMSSGEGGMSSGEGGSDAMGGAGNAAGAGGGGGDPPASLVGPCDIYEAAGTPCVAAHSTVRALFGSFDGALYQLRREDGMTQDISVLTPGGFADAAAQEAFCGTSDCEMWRIYDQTGNGNFLEAQTTESQAAPSMNGAMHAADATAEKITVGGNEVYSLFTRPSQAYWNNGSETGMPIGDEPQGVYMVTSGTHFNGGCCYNYGNGQLDRAYHGGPMMDAVYFGNSTQWGFGAEDGPWVMADMEDGMLAGGTPGAQNPDNLPLPFPFVTAMEKNNGTDTFALKGGDATQANNLTTMWDGPLPNTKRPMRKEGAVIMGAGGDCCYSNNNLSEGTFYEGAIVAGYPSDETDEAIHQNIVEVGYGQ